MPKSKKAVQRRWTAGDVRLLRSAARRKPVSTIARQLRRSEGAVKYKATMLKISLALGQRVRRAGG